MIARIWSGRTRAEDADAYLAYLRRTGLGDYGATDGNRGVLVLRRPEGEEAEFTLVSLWEDMGAIMRFAGEDVDRAVYYPEDDRFLLARAPSVIHAEVTDLVLPS